MVQFSRVDAASAGGAGVTVHAQGREPNEQWNIERVLARYPNVAGCAPVKRVASLDTWVAYSPQLEDVILPQVQSVLAAIEEITRF